MNTVTMSAIIVTLFLGGPSGPHWGILPSWLWPILFFVGKTFIFLFGYVWLRATLPRFRYDQLMDLGWKRLIPAALGWLLVLAGMLVSRVDGIVVAAIAIVVAALLFRAIGLGGEEAAADAAAGAARRRG